MRTDDAYKAVLERLANLNQRRDLFEGSRRHREEQRMKFKKGDKVTIAADDHLGFPKQRAIVIDHFTDELWTVQVETEDRDLNVNDENGIANVPEDDLSLGWE